MYQIYNEDCLEAMKKIPDNSVDMIATDPPYFSGMTSSGYQHRLGDATLTVPFFKECFSQWRRVLKDGGHLYMCTDWRTYPFMFNLLDRYFILRNCIVWDYGWLKAGSYYRFRHEFIIFATKGKSRREFENSNENIDIWRIRCINYTSSAKRHQAEKPVELMAKMICNSSREGDTVLDSFMGSGTTGVACVNLNREFIGFELDEAYYEIAEKRINEAIAQREQSLFNGGD